MAARVALLTRDEETALGRRVQAGLAAARDLDGCDDPDRRADLVRAVEDGRQAEAEFVRRNVGLVYKYANGFTGRGLDDEDLQQAGFIGLLTAIRKFDPERGFKLSTYASKWIMQTVQREIEKTGSAIRLPSHVHWKLAGRPDLQELLRPPQSLDAPLTPDVVLGDLLPSDEDPADTLTLRAQNLRDLRELLDELLTDEERQAILQQHDPDQKKLPVRFRHLAESAAAKLRADDRARQIFLVA